MTESELLVRRACAWCGIEYMAHRSDSRYCSEAHRQQAYRWRKRLPQLEEDARLCIEAIGVYLNFPDSRPLAHHALNRVVENCRNQQKVHKEPKTQ
jgi:hypothetical protein